MKGENAQSFNEYKQLRADLIAQRGVQENLNAIEGLYVMNQTLSILSNLLCQIYGTYLFDKLDESEKEDMNIIKPIIITVNKLDPKYPITPQTSLKDINGQDIAKMIGIIKNHLKKYTDVDMGYGIVDVDRIGNIDQVIRPFNSTFADVINQLLIRFINEQVDLFRGKNIVKYIEEDIFKA